MNNDAEILDIVKGLYVKTAKENLPWKEADGDFWLTLPASKVRIGFVSPPAEPDYIFVAMIRPDGKEVARFMSSERDQYWKLASDLYQLVNRKAGGWDKVREDLRRFLGEPEKAGR